MSHRTPVERVALGLKQQFMAVVSASADMPFKKTGVDMPADAIWLGYARAAIEALREPSEAMKNEPTWYDGKLSFAPGDAEAVWHQMIDAALAEGQK